MTSRDDQNVRVHVTLDDDIVLEWHGPKTDLTTNKPYAMPTESVGLTNWHTTVLFQKIRLRLLPPRTGENSALHFDGVDDFVEVAHSPSLNFSKGITIACWVYIENSLDGRFVNKWTRAAEDFTFMIHDRHAYFQILLVHNKSIFVRSHEPAPTKRWFHVAATYDSNSVRIYVDGKLNEQRSDTRRIRSAAGPVRIGGIIRDGHYRPPVLGRIDDLAIFNRGLSTAEITALMSQKTVRGVEPGCVACYSFDQGADQTLTDLSGNGNHGRLGKSSGPDKADPLWNVARKIRTPVQSREF